MSEREELGVSPVLAFLAFALVGFALLTIHLASAHATSNASVCNGDMDPCPQRKGHQIVVLLALHDSIMLENADQLSAVAEALRRSGRSDEIEILAGDPSERPGLWTRVRKRDLLLVIAPPSSTDAIAFMRTFRGDFPDVPVLMVSATSTKLPGRDERAYRATAGNENIADIIANAATTGLPPQLYYDASDHDYAEDLVRALHEELEARAQPLALVSEAPRAQFAPGEHAPCKLILIGRPAWFFMNRSGFPRCKHVLLSDGLASEEVKRALQHERVETIQVVEPNLEYRRDKCFGVHYWGRVALPALEHALRVEGPLDRAIVDERLRVFSGKEPVKFRLREVR